MRMLQVSLTLPSVAINVSGFGIGLTLVGTVFSEKMTCRRYVMSFSIRRIGSLVMLPKKKC